MQLISYVPTGVVAVVAAAPAEQLGAVVITAAVSSPANPLKLIACELSVVSP